MDDAQHGQLMNAVYRNQRYIYDITRKYYLLGRDRLIETLAPPQGGRVLEVACGTGRNLVAIGRHYPEARLFGFDISTEMLTTAGLPLRLADWRVDPQRLQQLAAEAAQQWTAQFNPRPALEQDMKDLYEAAF